MSKYLVVVGGQSYERVYFFGFHLQFVVGESQCSFECGFELSEVELSLAEDVEVPGLSSAPGVVEHFVGAGVDVAGDEGVEGLSGVIGTRVVLPFCPVMLESISLFLYWSTSSAAITYSFFM